MIKIASVWLCIGIFMGLNLQLSAQSDKISSFTDSRDGQKYQSIRIGKATWMIEDLRYEAEGSTLNDHGVRVYPWRVAKKACPKGWHLPKEKELKQLLWELHSGSLGLEAVPYFRLKEGKQYYWTDKGNALSVLVFQLTAERIQMYIDLGGSNEACRCVKN